MEQRLSLVTLGVSDLARSRAFYEALGWKTGAAPDDDVVVLGALGGRGPGGGRKDGGAASPGAQNGGGARGGEPWGACRRGPLPGRGGERFGGGYSGVFLDPDGYPWEVAHNPHWTIGEDGSVTLS